MNVLQGKIVNLTSHGNVSLVKIDVHKSMVSALLIDSPSNLNHLKEGHPIQVIFKETEVIIGKGDVHEISMQNKFIGEISKISHGELLSKLTINTHVGSINSIITSNAVKQLDLKTGSKVTAMIKTNEIILSE